MRGKVLHYFQVPFVHIGTFAFSSSGSLLDERALFSSKKPKFDGELGSRGAKGFGGPFPPWAGVVVSAECH